MLNVRAGGGMPHQHTIPVAVPNQFRHQGWLLEFCETEWVIEGVHVGRLWK